MLALPSAPPASVVPPHEKPDANVSVVPMLFPVEPPVFAVTVTVAPEAAAVTVPDVDEFELIADASAVASLDKLTDDVELSVLVENVVVEFDPEVPPVRFKPPLPPKPAPVNPDAIVVLTLMLLPASPVADAVIVTVLDDPPTVTPTVPA
jgi:hypothetical protein